MEKIISENEKIRRAEEIYNRRRLNGVRVPTSTVNSKNGKRNYSLAKKMILQICICIMIYTAVYLVQNSNYIFSDSVISKTKEILAYDINMPEKFNQIVNQIKENKFFNLNLNFNNKGIIPANNQNTNETTNENNITEKTLPSEEEQKEAGNNTKPAGNVESSVTLGATETTVYYEDVSSYNQMQIDANTIKEKYQIQLPLKGEITSRFGLRQIEPKFHSGIDIAANTGTGIVSAIDGKVTLVSTTGDYGKHLKVENGDLTTLYAHCNTLLVKEGDIIQKGQKIAEVGKTGNATGPHLHFEMILSGRILNPEYIMTF